MALKNIVLLVLTITCFMATATATRELPIKPGFNLEARLEASGGIFECWNALSELKSCTNEIIVFFLSGQADIGPDCCKAITTITHNCWPTMLTSLGFTVEEGNILKGYCDVSSGPVASPPLAGLPVQPLPSAHFMVKF